MFGIFKKKNTKDDQFIQELAMFAADFNPVMRAIDPQGVEEMLRRATNNYFKRTPEESAYIPSDFYFDAFTGAIFELIERNFAPPEVNLGIFSMVDSFLRGNPRYQTALTLGLMNKWQNILINTGAIKI